MLSSNRTLYSRAFTIVELLIVIVVIGILATITITAYNGIQQRARDSDRISSLNQLQKAIELYYVDNGRYPAITHGLGFESSCGSQTENWGHCDRLKALTDALAPYVLLDPTSFSSATQGNYHYSYDSQTDDNFQTYGLIVTLEGNGGANDGGYYSTGYELGQNPRYCKDKYTGSDADWLNTGGVYNQRCFGGN